MATYTPIGYWLDLPIVELAEWTRTVADEIQAQQKRQR